MADKTTRKYTSIRSLDTPAQLTEHLDKIKRSRQDQELEWRLNLSFYRGDQWVWKGLDGRIWGYPVQDGERPRNRVRLTSNQILPNVNAYVAQLTKTKPLIFATPDSEAEADLVAAQVADDLNVALWRTLSLQDRLHEALTWAVIGSVGWWKISYDPFQGGSLDVLLDPEGNPVPNNPDLKDAFLRQLEQMGAEPQMAKLKMGDLRVDCLSPFQVFSDPSARVFSDAQYAYCEHPMTPDEVYTRFGVEVSPNATRDSNEALRPWRRSSSTNEMSEVVNIRVGYFRPGPVVEDGRYVVWCDDVDEPLIDKRWDLPTDKLPLVPFPGIRVPGVTEWEALVTHSRPIQKEINKTISQLALSKDLTLGPRYWAPAGSFEGTLVTTEAGAIRYYNPVGGMKPEPEIMPPIPEYIIALLQDLQMRMDRLFNLQAITRGDVPPNVEAGIAIDLLQEAAVDQVTPQIQGIEDALVDAGTLLTQYAGEYYTEPRMLKIVGDSGTTRVRKFLQTDLEGGFSFHCEAGSGLPRSRAGRSARIQQLMQMGLVQPQQAWKYFELADLKGLKNMFAADEDLVLREHEALLNGGILNDVELDRATEAAKQGVNIYSGQPLKDENEAMQVIQDASITPLVFESTPLHLDAHAMKMKSVEFSQYPVEVKARFQRHFELSKQKFMQEQPDDPKTSPRTSLSLHGTVGPTVAAKILQKSNVDAAPQELLEPPLETLVMDSVDQVDKDEAANDPFTDMEKQDALLTAELKRAELMEKVSLARARALAEQKRVEDTTTSEIESMQKIQDMQHKEEKHEIEVEQAAQQAAQSQREHILSAGDAQRVTDEKVKTSRAQRRSARKGSGSGKASSK